MYRVLLTMVNGRVARTRHTTFPVVIFTKEKRKRRGPNSSAVSREDGRVQFYFTVPIDSQELFRVFPRTRMLRQVRGFVSPLLLFFVSHFLSRAMASPGHQAATPTGVELSAVRYLSGGLFMVVAVVLPIVAILLKKTNLLASSAAASRGMF